MPFQRICQHVALNVFEILFSVISATILFIAVGAANDLGDGAPGDGFLVLAVLIWAFVLGVAAVWAHWVHVAIGRQTIGILMARSLLALLGLNSLSSGILSALTVHTIEGRIFTGVHWVCAGLCLLLFWTTGRANWRRLVVAGLCLPMLLVFGAVTYTRVNGGVLIWQASAPGGETVAEVRRFRSETCVELQSGLNPLRTCVFIAGRGDFSVRWIDEKNLQIQCKDCDADDSENLICSWRNVSIHYDFAGLSSSVRRGCP